MTFFSTSKPAGPKEYDHFVTGFNSDFMVCRYFLPVLLKKFETSLSLDKLGDLFPKIGVVRPVNLKVFSRVNLETFVKILLLKMSK